MSRRQDNEAVDALEGAMAALLTAPLQVAAALAGAFGARQSEGCEIPPPCWEPRPAGACRLVLTPDGTGLIRVLVSNCGWARQVVGITGLGKLAGWLTLQPTTLVLDAQERATFSVTVRPPKGIKPGQNLVGTILVRGCRDHAIKVEVKIRECATQTCCDVSVEDCPDHIHHWYDHFYCPRPCNRRDARAREGSPADG